MYYTSTAFQEAFVTIFFVLYKYVLMKRKMIKEDKEKCVKRLKDKYL